MHNSSVSSGVGCAHTEIECNLILEQAVMGNIRRIRRRMNERERRCIKSGDFFVYSEEESKIRRWTDSRKWSPSRVNGSFMMYYEIRELNPMIKKTYSTIYKGFRYHIVFYNLLSEDKTRMCCQKYKNKPLQSEQSHDILSHKDSFLISQTSCFSKQDHFYHDKIFRQIDEEDLFHKYSRDFY